MRAAHGNQEAPAIFHRRRSSCWPLAQRETGQRTLSELLPTLPSRGNQREELKELEIGLHEARGEGGWKMGIAGRKYLLTKVNQGCFLCSFHLKELCIVYCSMLVSLIGHTKREPIYLPLSICLQRGLCPGSCNPSQHPLSSCSPIIHRFSLDHSLLASSGHWVCTRNSASLSGVSHCSLTNTLSLAEQASSLDQKASLATRSPLFQRESGHCTFWLSFQSRFIPRAAVTFLSA